MGLSTSMSGTLHSYRRFFFLGFGLLTLLVTYEAYQIYKDTIVVPWARPQNHGSTEKLSPSESKDQSPAHSPVDDILQPAPELPDHVAEPSAEATPAPSVIPTVAPTQSIPEDSQETTSELANDLPSGSGATNGTTGTTGTSRLHFVFPATSENDLFCSVIAASLANRYPIPYIVGWKGEGEFNASAMHTAKLRTIKRYLDDLPQGGEVDDLVIVGDGHDVMAQLPADVMIERYFQMAADADQRLADRFGMTVEAARQHGLRQTLFWGADKMCWPPLHSEAQCKSIPLSPLPHSAFGPKSGSSDKAYHHARYFNSGSVIGPLGDLRKFVDAGLAEMESTYDKDFEWKNSDQVYLQRVWAQQELARTELVELGFGAGDENDDEYHVAIDYDATFVQTGCFYDKWRHRLVYNGTDNTVVMTKDYFDQGKDNFEPYPIQMPANVFQSLLRIFTSTPELRESSSMSAQEWIHSLELDTNIVSETIYSFYHATCSKAHLLEEFHKFWFHPYIKPLLKAAVGAVETGQPLTTKDVDGRQWVYQTAYDRDVVSEDELGGVFTDHEEEAFIPYTTLCADYLDIL